MLDGRFSKTKRGLSPYDMPLLVLIFLLLTFADEMSSIVKIICFALGILLMLLKIAVVSAYNRCFFKIRDEHIEGRYGISSKINCGIEDIGYATVNQGALVLVEKSGRQHAIWGLENALQLCSYIIRHLPVDRHQGFDELRANEHSSRSKRKRDLILAILMTALLLANIFVAVFLTGGREIKDQTQTDTAIMICFAAVELLTAFLCFFFANKASKGKYVVEMNALALKRALILTSPLLPGCARYVYTDESFCGRITVFGYPNDSSVYFCTESIDRDLCLVNHYTSEIFECEDALPDGRELLWDITDIFI